MSSHLLARIVEGGRNHICSALVAAMDVRSRKRGRRLSAAEKSLVKSMLRPGDILLDSNDSFPGWQFASRLLFGSAWVHMGLYIGDNVVIDAGKEAEVAALTVNRFLNTSSVAILRPKYACPQDIESAARQAKALVGRRYNSHLDLGQTGDVYCTQLIRDALKSMPNPILVETRRILGRDIVAPQAFMDHPDIELIWASQNSFNGATVFGSGFSGRDESTCTS